MGIAEINNKTSLIKSNVPKVYEAGQITGGGGVDYDEAYQDGYKDGKESVPDYLYYVNNLNGSFGGAVFPENFEFVLRVQRLANASAFAGTFNNCFYLKTLKLINENPNNLVLNMQNTFACGSGNTPTLEIVDLTEFNKKFSNCLNTFRYQKVLKSILGKIDLSGCTSTANMFQNCEALEDVEFESGTINISISFAQSSKLSTASIQSIVDGLATVTTTQSLTLSSNVLVALSSDQMSQILAKNWSVA